VLTELVAMVFPATCPGCGHRAEPICAGCAGGLRAPVPVPPPLGVDGWVAPFAYEGVARELIARVKYRGARAAVPFLADAIAGVATPLVARLEMEVVTWAPTTARRRHARGFDHAQLLARAVARRLDLPIAPLLYRAPGPPQTGRAAAARRSGPAFRAAEHRRGGRALVVDDVATTGATLAAAAAALRASGVARVGGACAARTPPKGREGLVRGRGLPPGG
jgi:predicted amidophosphoribosyltransferase